MFGIKKVKTEFSKGLNTLSGRITCVKNDVKKNYDSLLIWSTNIIERVGNLEKRSVETVRGMAEFEEFVKIFDEIKKRQDEEIKELKEDIWRLQNPPKHKAGDIVLLGKDGKEKFTVLEVIPKRYEKKRINVGSDVSFSWLYKVINNKTKETSTLVIGVLSH